MASGQGHRPLPAAAVAAALSGELGRTPQDASPRLYSIWAREDGCELRAEALPAGAWQSGPPAFVVAMLASGAAALAASPEYRAPDGLHGIAVRGQLPAFLAGNTGGVFMAAHDRAGNAYTAVRERASSKGATTVRITRPEAGTQAEGTLPFALKLLVNEITRTPAQGSEPEAWF